VAFRDDVQFSYLFDNFVWSSYGSPWLQMAAAGRLDALSLEACRAFSLSIFGKHHHQRDIEVSGAMHYDHTVRALSSRLSYVGSSGSEGLIVPITILLMHSVGYVLLTCHLTCPPVRKSLTQQKNSQRLRTLRRLLSTSRGC
jgi:hypothetical protein